MTKKMTKKQAAELVELKELRRLERICLEQAQAASMEIERAGLLQVAEDCRIAAQKIEVRLNQGDSSKI